MQYPAPLAPPEGEALHRGLEDRAGGDLRLAAISERVERAEAHLALPELQAAVVLPRRLDEDPAALHAIDVHDVEASRREEMRAWMSRTSDRLRSPGEGPRTARPTSDTRRPAPCPSTCCSSTTAAAR